MARKRSTVLGLAKIFEEGSETTKQDPRDVLQADVDSKHGESSHQHDPGRQHVSAKESSDIALTKDGTTKGVRQRTSTPKRKVSMENKSVDSGNTSMTLRNKKRPSVSGLVKRFEGEEAIPCGEDNVESNGIHEPNDCNETISDQEDSSNDASDVVFGTPTAEIPTNKSTEDDIVICGGSFSKKTELNDEDINSDTDDEFSISGFCDCIAFDASTQIGDENSSIDETEYEAAGQSDKEGCSFCGTPLFIDPDLQSFMDKYESTIICPTCLKEWCYNCKAPVHEGITCREYAEKGDPRATSTTAPEAEPEVAPEVPTTSSTDKRKGDEQGTVRSAKKLLLKRAECETCLETKLTWQPMCCNVHVCLICLDLYISSKVEQGVIDIQCPGHSCETLMDPAMIKSVVVNEKSKRLSFLRVKSNRYKNRKACPICDFVLSMDDSVLHFYKEFESIVLCPKCENEWCFHCMVPWHEGLSCAAYKASSTDTGVTAWANKSKTKTGIYKERNAQKCPSCKVLIYVICIYI